jgi:hypothetical protein
VVYLKSDVGAAVKTMEGVKCTSINLPSASIQFVSLGDKAVGA